MEKIFDYGLDDNRNAVCSKMKSLDILLYLSSLAIVDCAFTTNRNKEFIFRVYNHIKKCDICREGYEFSKEIYSSHENYKGIFFKEHFGMIRKNEEHLDRIVRD